MDKTIKIGVADFALPVPRVGSIDNNSGFGSLTTGLELHQQIQQLKKKTHSQYQAEVKISQRFITEDFTFEVSGRIDGFYHDTHKIEEIKSSFDLKQLVELLKSNPEHPYCWQLKTYGYLYWLQNNIIPELSFCLVSSRNQTTQELTIPLDINEYEQWLAARLAELVLEAQATEAMIKRRKGMALTFPYEQPRSGQMDLVARIEQSIAEKKYLLVQAPTGVGKTIGVMYPVLKEALARGQKAIYVTPKNSQHAVAEDAVWRLQQTGAKLKSLTLTAKPKMCLKDEPICNPQYCEYAKDHYTKVQASRVIEKLLKKKTLSANIIKKAAKANAICPYEIQFSLLKNIDVLICDYNYVFSPRASALQVAAGAIGEKGKPNLIIDEIHNLPNRSMEYYSAVISVTQLSEWAIEIKKLNFSLKPKILKLLNASMQIITQAGVSQPSTQHKITPPLLEFQQQNNLLKEALGEYLATDVIIEAGNPVLKFIFAWAEFTENLLNAAQDAFFVTFNPKPATLKIICCDASLMLTEYYKNFANVTGFSATLKPFEYYSQLTGLHSTKVQTAEFLSPFPTANRKILIIPQLSSKYNDRVRSCPRIAETIEKIISLKKGNYLVFFPSFEFLNQVLAIFQAPKEFSVLLQTRNMSKATIQAILDQLPEEQGAYVLFAVQGGVFAEGIDYKNNLAIGAFIVGPPLPNYNFESEQMREYYQRQYQNGYDYTYTYPAMAKAIQSAGRVIRSETDKGLIVLLDNRFVRPEFARCMPADWFGENAMELVSTSILSDLAKFWLSTLA